MTELSSIKSKLDEFKTFFNSIVNSFPVPYSNEKDRILKLLDFAEERLNESSFDFLSESERVSILNTFASARSQLAAFSTNKNPGHINTAFTQIAALRTSLNQWLPIVVSLTENDASQIKKDIKDRASEFDNLIAKLKIDGDGVVTSFKDNVEKIISDFKNKEQEAIEAFNSESAKIRGLENDVKSLLPGSMAIALASEFEKKRKREYGGWQGEYIRENSNTKNNFNIKWYFCWNRRERFGTHSWATSFLIFFLISILCMIVFGDYVVDKVLNLTKDKDGNIINPPPHQLILFTKILLTSPLLWMAIVFNKRMNLSKKLAEEYWHKEIIAKTYTGLSREVEKYPDSGIKQELSNKLLNMTLDAFGKNPAECISNHDKAENPLSYLFELSGKKLDTALKAKDFLSGISNSSSEIDKKES